MFPALVKFIKPKVLIWIEMVCAEDLSTAVTINIEHRIYTKILTKMCIKFLDFSFLYQGTEIDKIFTFIIPQTEHFLDHRWLKHADCLKKLSHIYWISNFWNIKRKLLRINTICSMDLKRLRKQLWFLMQLFPKAGSTLVLFFIGWSKVQFYHQFLKLLFHSMMALQSLYWGTPIALLLLKCWSFVFAEMTEKSRILLIEKQSEVPSKPHRFFQFWFPVVYKSLSTEGLEEDFLN